MGSGTCGLSLWVALVLGSVASAGPGGGPPIPAHRDWGPLVGWRGDGTGKYPAADPPTRWGPSTNVLWATEMPDRSNASPVVVAGRAFVTAEPTKLLCLDAANGKILWTRDNTYADVMTPREVAQGKLDKVAADKIRGDIAPVRKQMQAARVALQKAPKDEALKRKIADLRKQLGALNAKLAPLTQWEAPPTEKANGYSSPTPVSADGCVYVLFGTGVTACYDLDGNRRWIRYVGRTPIGDGHSASPVLADGKLLVHVTRLAALDPATGKELWSADRTAPGFGTPVVARLGDVKVVVTAAGDVVRLSDGQVLARTISNVSYCSPIVSGGVAYFVQNISKGHGGGHAVRLSAPTGESAKTQILWQTKPPKDRYYASPVIEDGLIYAVNQANAFSVIEAASGQVLYAKTLELGKGTVFPSIVLAGGLLFVSNDNGTTAVLKGGREPALMATNKLEPFRSSPVAVGKRIYIRTLKHLYCIGESEGAEPSARRGARGE